jgi:hypothetical protein
LLVEGGTFGGGLLAEREPARPSLILSEGLARRLFPARPAVGRQLTLRDGRATPVPYEIVGVLRRSLVLGGVGVALGWAGAHQAAGLLRSRLYGVEPLDLATFAAAAVAMLLVTVLASLMPARRATRVSPVEVLRRD